MFDIFDDMDDFALDFDMASESYLDSVDEEINEWEDDTANEAVGYDAIKDKVDAALEDFVENAKFAGKVVWAGIKKAAAAIKAFFKALPGRIGKFIRQSIEKIKQKFREGVFNREKADDKAKRLSGELTAETKTCIDAAAKLKQVIVAEINGANKQSLDAKEVRDTRSAAAGDADKYVRLNDIYSKYNKAFNSSFDKVLKSSIGFTKALARGKASLASEANNVIKCLNDVINRLLAHIDVLEKGATTVESKYNAAKEENGYLSAGARVQHTILSQYRNTISNFSAKKNRIDEQLEYINNALRENEKRAAKNSSKSESDQKKNK